MTHEEIKALPDLEWLTKFWAYTFDNENIGDIFTSEMDGLRYKSAGAIIAWLREEQAKGWANKP